MGQVLVLTRRAVPAAAPVRAPRALAHDGLDRVRGEQPAQVVPLRPRAESDDQVLEALPSAAQVHVSPRAARRRAAVHERGAARARRIASASVEGSLSDLELTRRGRWVLWSTALAVATGMAVMGGGALASTPELPREVVPHTVVEGENLWGLAESIALPGEDLRDVVDLIVEVNGRASASLWAGEQILLPVHG